MNFLTPTGSSTTNVKPNTGLGEVRLSVWGTIPSLSASTAKAASSDPASEVVTAGGEGPRR